MNNLTDNQKKVLKALEVGKYAITEISEITGIPKASLSSILSSLVKKGLITRSDDGVYSASSENSDPRTEDTSIEAQPDNPIALLIPYLKKEAAGEELKYALRSWEQHFTSPFRVIVIGDKEDWFSDEVLHIPHTPHLVKEVCDCPAPSMIRNPQADVAHKVFTAITVEGLSGKFILSNDDIYLLGETTLSDLETLKAFIHNLEQTGKGKGLYAQNNRLAAKALKANGKPVVRYGTHTPMVFEAEKMLQIIEKYDATEKGYPLASLYYNEIFPNARPILLSGGVNDPILASAYRDNIPSEVLDEVFEKRKFMNCDALGWKSVEAKLKSTFTVKSRFEK